MRLVCQNRYDLDVDGRFVPDTGVDGQSSALAKRLGRLLLWK